MQHVTLALPPTITVNTHSMIRDLPRVSEEAELQTAKTSTIPSHATWCAMAAGWEEQEAGCEP
jgi:hypothetical protein